MATLKTLREKWEKNRRKRKRQFKLFRKTGKRGHQRAAGAAGRAMRKLKKLIKRRTPVRVKALQVAEGLVGVMEHGGNNTGPIVDKIITANGGVIGEPWCGDFCAYCYRLAGSKAVQRLWASVSALFGLLGIRRTSLPKRGDLVRFIFDHVGLFVRYLRWTGSEYVECSRSEASHIETIEGNTGESGAVSDSATGGDGVYRKVRDKALVNDYLRVTR